MQNAPTRDALEWIRERDEATRASAVMNARSEIPFGEALHDAWMEHRLEWDSTSGRSKEREMEEDDEITDGTPSKRSRKAEKRSSQRSVDSGSNIPNVSGKQVYGSTLPGNRHICKAWVNGMCTPKESACPQKRPHVCDIILPNGKVCGGAHRRAGHPKE